MMSKGFNSLLLFIFIICAINFFEFQAIKGSVIKYFQFAYLLAGIVISLPYLFPKKINGFVLPVQLISFSIILSIFISGLTWGQSFMDSLAGTLLTLIWVVFFYLKHIKFPVEKIEKIFLIYGVIYIILYFFQFTHADRNYFVDIETIDLSRGISRIVFPGQGVFYVTIYMAINRVTNGKRNRWLWAFLAIIGVVVTVMQVTRQYIFAVVIIYLYHFLKDQKFYIKIGIISCVVVMTFYITQSDNPIVKGLMDTQEQTQERGVEDVRVLAAKFFLTDFSPSTINKILGNGVPYGVNSNYNKFNGSLVVNYGFWLSDVGLIAVYIMFGVFAVLGYILIWVKSFVIKLPRDYFYLKYYLWYLLLTSITSATSYLSSNLITTVLVIYIYQTIYEREKLSLSIFKKRTLIQTSKINK